MKESSSPKVWFIAGSARGPARALAETVLNAGNAVIVTARHPDELKDLVTTHGIRVFPLFLDTTKSFAAEAAVDAAFSAFGRVDVFVNNPACGFHGSFEELTPTEFEARMAGEPGLVELPTLAALPLMHRQGFGQILQITAAPSASESEGELACCCDAAGQV